MGLAFVFLVLQGSGLADAKHSGAFVTAGASFFMPVAHLGAPQALKMIVEEELATTERPLQPRSAR